MKRTYLVLFALLFTVLLVSCGKEPVESGGNADPADEFVGVYTYTDTFKLTWGTDVTEDTEKGTFTVVKTGTNGVDVTGSFNTKGLVIPGICNFVTVSIDDESMKATMTFGPATVSGGVMSFQYSVYGRAYRDGFMRTYEKKGTVSAVKNNG